MIYVTGDTHANIDIAKLNTTKFPQQKELTKNDFVIICGDFGLCWDGSHREMWWQDWLTAKNFTTLWIDDKTSRIVLMSCTASLGAFAAGCGRGIVLSSKVILQPLA